jgi:glycolate oxidase FAD binding subunit
MLKQADAEGLAVEVRGGGTKAAWGTPTARAGVVLSTTHLAGAVDHVAGDLTATVPAGATLEEVNATLRRHHQWHATIGGILATNDSGPRRHLFGTPRDLVIGIEVALVDGRTAKAGGRVVKNVAGYDLSRLMCGSFGSLAVVTSATFKLSPLPQSSRTVVAAVDDAWGLGTLAMMIASSPLSPTAVELDAPPHRLMVRFESTPDAAHQQAVTAANLCVQEGARTMILATEDEVTFWREHEARIWDGAETVLKVTTLPTGLGDLIEQLTQAAAGVEARVSGRAGLGIVLVRIDGETAATARAVASVREYAVSRRGSAVIVSGSAALKALVDPWGTLGDALPAMRAVKARFDPHGILNPGRGPGGL